MSEELMMAVLSDSFNRVFSVAKPPPPPYESPIDEEKCKGCGEWESKCVCE